MRDVEEHYRSISNEPIHEKWAREPIPPTSLDGIARLMSALERHYNDGIITLSG